MQFQFQCLFFALVHITWIAATMCGIVWFAQHIGWLSKPSSRHWSGMFVLLTSACLLPLLYVLGMLLTDGPNAVAVGTPMVSDQHQEAESSRWIPELGQTGINLISVSYLAGLYYHLFSLGLDWFRMHRIDRLALPGAFAERVQPIWQKCVEQESRTDRLEVLLSSRIEMPMLSGYWKSRVLLPLDMATNAESRHLEIAIRHELAHWSRKDHVWLWWQRAGDCLLFFHPGILAISKRISVEREILADLKARENFSGHSRQFASGMLDLAEGIKQKQNRLSLAAVSVPSAFSERIQFILDPKAPWQPAGRTAGNCVVGLLLALAGVLTGPVTLPKHVVKTGPVATMEPSVISSLTPKHDAQHVRPKMQLTVRPQISLPNSGRGERSTVNLPRDPPVVITTGQQQKRLLLQQAGSSKVLPRSPVRQTLGLVPNALSAQSPIVVRIQRPPD